ncbi:hypothetical protein ACH5RR_009540 [Cinchona calisaya]|uniref:Uncharacterized protein n=1 Tax=Cinchona calisaya TaxID=153742 RepID=A0ABD3AFB0_9GENT
MAQGNKPVIYCCIAPGEARFMYAPPAYHGEIGVQNCHCGKTYPDHVTIHIAEERDHLLGEIEVYRQEEFEEDPKKDLEEKPEENHGGNVEEESESSDGIVVVD